MADGSKSQQLSIVVLTTTLLCVEFVSAQRAIADLIFSGDNVNVRWQTQCTSGLEMYDIIYGCSQGAINDSDLITERYSIEADGSQPYREKKLQLPLRNQSTGWKCVFRLLGLSSNTRAGLCSTMDTPCYLIDSQTFREIRAGIIIKI